MGTSGYAVMTASGKRGVLAGGKVAVFNASGDCDDCCGGAACAYCSGSTPASLNADVDGLTPCPACFVVNWYGVLCAAKWITPPTLDGSYTLSKVSQCQWNSTETISGEMRVWTVSAGTSWHTLAEAMDACAADEPEVWSGEVVDVDVTSAVITVGIMSGAWYGTILLNGSLLLAFSGMVAVSTPLDCTTDNTPIPNDNLDSDCGSDVYHSEGFYGGTITPNP